MFFLWLPVLISFILPSKRSKCSLRRTTHVPDSLKTFRRECQDFSKIIKGLNGINGNAVAVYPMEKSI